MTVNALLRASQYENTAAGSFLATLYYRTYALDLVKGNVTGYPHDGGMHSLTFHLNKDFHLSDVEVFLTIVEDQYKNVHGCSEFVVDVRAKMVALAEKLNLHGDGICEWR
jgi:hypothetical protein